MRFLKLASASFMLVAFSFVPMLAAAATEPLSGLPLFPGAKPGEPPASQAHCGVSMRSVVYEVDNASTKPVDFFHKVLPGATSWSIANGNVTAFLTSNGKAIVKVLNTSPNSYSIVYGSYSKPVTVKQVRTGTC
jgi:hypothetical protein